MAQINYILIQGWGKPNHGKNTISIIIDKTDKEGKVEQPKLEQVSTSDIADELGKLATLKAQGILTEEEFQKQKEKLLNN